MIDTSAVIEPAPARAVMVQVAVVAGAVIVMVEPHVVENNAFGVGGVTEMISAPTGAVLAVKVTVDTPPVVIDVGAAATVTVGTVAVTVTEAELFGAAAML